MIQIIFDGWFETSVCLWPKDDAASRKDTPISPSESFFSDSGIDTVF